MDPAQHCRVATINGARGRLAGPRPVPMLLLALLTAVLPAPAATATAPASSWSARAAHVYRAAASVTGDETGTPYIADPSATAQDRTGFIWVGTSAGLARWDGQAMRLYAARPGAACAIQNNLALTVHADLLGRLWIGSSGYLALYTPEDDCIRTLAAQGGALAGAVVEAFADDGAGGMWIGTNLGLRHLHADLTQWLPVPDAGAVGAALGRERTSQLLRDRSGGLWIGGDGGLVRLAPDGLGFVRAALPAGARVRALVEGADGRLWVGTVANGAYVVDPTTLHLRAVPGLAGRDEVPLLLRAALAPNGEIWFATPSRGMLIVDPVSLATRWLRRQRGVPGSPPHDALSGVRSDRRGLMWVPSPAGLGFYDVDAPLSAIVLSDALNGLPEGSVTAVAAMADGRLATAIGTGIVIAGALPAQSERVALALPSPPQTITALASPDGHDLFVTGQPFGLAWIDRDARRTHVIELPGPGSSRHPFALLVDGPRLWVTGLEGIWRLERRTPARAGDPPWVAAARYDATNVIAAAVSADGASWFGADGGLLRLDAHASTPMSVTLHDASGNAIASPSVVSLRVDRRGRLWAGTNEDGVYVLATDSARTDSLRVVRHVLDDLPDASVAQIVEDASGDVWAATERGLARIDGRSFAVRRLTRGDGLAMTGFAPNAAIALANGELLFGARAGFLLARPDAPEPVREPPAVVVTRITIDNREVPATRFNVGTQPAALEVPAGAERLTVEFAALDYVDPARNQYEHQLEGSDPGWVRSEMRMAMYMRLAPGTYRLRLRGSDHGGAWSPHERQLLVRVAATWYQTNWFRALAVLAGGLALVLLIETRTLLLRRRQRELEAQVADRTRALVDATAARTALVANLAHDLRTPLTSLRAYLERLGLKERSLPDEERTRYVAIATRQAERLHRRVQELFDLVRLNDAAARLTIEGFVPADLVQDVAHEFAVIGDGRTVRYQPAPDVESVQMQGDIGLVQRMIENLVDNAVRHTPADGWVEISLARDGDSLVLKVADNGSGIDPADLARIFDRYERGDTAGRIAGAGLGLAIVKKIVELHAGTVSVASRVGGGAAFTVRLPLAGPPAAPRTSDADQPPAVGGPARPGGTSL